jgi:hypothetical protein
MPQACSGNKTDVTRNKYFQCGVAVDGCPAVFPPGYLCMCV